MPVWLVEDGDDCVVRVWVVPGANRSEVAGTHGDALKVRVSAPPEGGRANRAVVDLIGRRVGARATLDAGTTSRAKRVRLHDVAPQAVLDRLI